MITANNIRKTYGENQALTGVNLEVKPGELFGVIGPDGAGKSTFFKILTSLILPDEGEINMWGLDPVKDYKKVRRMIGYMPGKFSLYHDLSIEENLSFFATVFGTTIEENYHLIKDIYSQIAPFKKRLAGRLSGGMKQKLALSCALIHSPELLVLDEPTTGVDAVSRREFWEMLQKLKEKNITILVSTPYMDEAKMCDRVALMDNGKILEVNTPHGITQSFKETLYGIRTNKIGQLIKDLKAYETVKSSFPFGEFVHYTDKEPELNKNHLIQYLKENEHQDIQIEIIQPTIEDRFLDLAHE